MATQHTKGPWKIRVTEGKNCDVISDKGEDIAICFSSENPTQKANARLIAAAPELLEALKELWSASFERRPHDSLARLQNAQMKASDAIAKATNNTTMESR